MVFLWLTQDQAEALAANCINPAIRRDLARQIRLNRICGSAGAGPRTVILEDRGDGVHMNAVAYFSAEDAQAAWDRWWAEVVLDNEQQAADTPLLVER